MAYEGKHRGWSFVPTIPGESPEGVEGHAWVFGALLALGLLVVMMLAGCGAQPFGDGGVAQPARATPPPVHTLHVGDVDLTIIDVFGTSDRRKEGLQHRVLPPKSGAVFSWSGSSTQESFWMINTPEPLSLLWVAAGKVIGHTEMARCAMSCPTYAAPAPYDTAVEAVAGAFRHVHKGQKVRFQ